MARELDPYFSTVEKFYIVLYVYMSARPKKNKLDHTDLHALLGFEAEDPFITANSTNERFCKFVKSVHGTYFIPSYAWCSSTYQQGVACVGGSG